MPRQGFQASILIKIIRCGKLEFNMCHVDAVENIEQITANGAFSFKYYSGTFLISFGFSDPQYCWSVQTVVSGVVPIFGEI